jgi:hypothetical protein
VPTETPRIRCAWPWGRHQRSLAAASKLLIFVNDVEMTRATLARPSATRGGCRHVLPQGSPGATNELAHPVPGQPSAQVVEAGGGVGVVGSQHPLPDVQGALVEGPGGGQLALGLEQMGQVVEAGGGGGAVRSQRPL